MDLTTIKAQYLESYEPEALDALTEEELMAETARMTNVRVTVKGACADPRDDPEQARKDRAQYKEFRAWHRPKALAAHEALARKYAARTVSPDAQTLSGAGGISSQAAVGKPGA